MTARLGVAEVDLKGGRNAPNPFNGVGGELCLCALEIYGERGFGLEIGRRHTSCDPAATFSFLPGTYPWGSLHLSCSGEVCADLEGPGGM